MIVKAAGVVDSDSIPFAQTIYRKLFSDGSNKK